MRRRVAGLAMMILLLVFSVSFGGLGEVDTSSFHRRDSSHSFICLRVPPCALLLHSRIPPSSCLHFRRCRQGSPVNRPCPFLGISFRAGDPQPSSIAFACTHSGYIPHILFTCFSDHEGTLYRCGTMCGSWKGEDIHNPCSAASPALCRDAERVILPFRCDRRGDAFIPRLRCACTHPFSWIDTLRSPERDTLIPLDDVLSRFLSSPSGNCA